MSTALFGQILDVLTNLRSLIFDSPFSYECDQRFSFGNTSTLFFPTLVELHVNVVSFDDCVYLLDGCFNQLLVFHVKFPHIKSTRTIENQVGFSKKTEQENVSSNTVMIYTSIY